MRILPRPEERLRAVMNQAMGQAMDQAPKAEAVAARWVERTRPVWSWLVLEWRRLGTAAAILIIFGLVLHAMFGANGMVVYRQKRTEVQSLQTEVERLQKENSQYANQIKSLKSDPAAFEKEDVRIAPGLDGGMVLLGARTHLNHGRNIELLHQVLKADRRLCTHGGILRPDQVF